MSLEAKIDELIAALNSHAEALRGVTKLAAGAPTPAAAKPKKTEADRDADAKARVEKTEAEASTAAPAPTIGSMIEAMLRANKRKEAVALLKKYKATKASEVPSEKTEEFIAQAEEILIAA